MTKQSRIAVVGSANVDLTTFSDRFPKPGETIFGDHFDLGWGGKGANQAVAARLCGAAVAMVARVGNDLFGPATVANFQAQGIDAALPGITFAAGDPAAADPDSEALVLAQGKVTVSVIEGNFGVGPVARVRALAQLGGLFRPQP